MISKNKRIVNKDLIDNVKRQKCLCCGVSPVDAHHIKSVRSGGHDIDSNLMPLCRAAHTKIHSKGLNYMAMAYSNIQDWLESHGWAKEQGKWRRWK